MNLHLNKKLIGTIVVIGLVLMAVEFAKSPERARYRRPGTSDIPVETALEHQSAAASPLGIVPTCTNGQCTSTTEAPPEPLVNTPLAAPPTSALPDRVMTKQKQYKRAQEIVSPDGFINLPSDTVSLKLSDLVGKKVILVDFWTYSCINCQRTQPYLNAWYEKYRDHGLEIVGIHTPEFMFEKKYENVFDAVRREGIAYPVVLDNGYGTWYAYGNRFWPRKYLIDIDGFVVYDHIGEGAYDETEREIQRALAERSRVLGTDQVIPDGSVDPSQGADAPPIDGAVSPETYFGAGRNANLQNGPRGVGGTRAFTAPEMLVVQSGLYLVGDWNIQTEYAENVSAEARIIYRYLAKDVYMVASADSPVKLKLLRDGRPLSSAEAGGDIVFENGESVVTIRDERLYRLVRASAFGDHTLEIVIESPGLKAFTFTFG